ncbi:MAG: Stp1/IreP family PP2C-type Ser/Thr phosphatase [Anaerolineaceae bacterium]|nr:Stp1/IreP family PP2C-type Ser/Thr phosphatase [Anaerolineaceae bacterium]
MHDPGYDIRLRSSAQTSTGQVRQNNEDNIHLWSRDKYVLAVVADGMGGAAAGEEASRIAVDAIEAGMAMRDYTSQDALQQMTDEMVQGRLSRAIQTANLQIMRKAAASPEMRGMGTTVTLAFIRQTHVIVAHVGDSRAYLVDHDDGDITQITADHSFVQALLAAGHITHEQAEEHPMRNVLYRALGQAEDVEVDIYVRDLHIGDRLVLCSDGLTRHVHPEEIAEFALAYDNPDTVSQKLIALANERGGEDNVSVIVILVEPKLPTLPPEKEAALADEHDDEKTLVLKDRQRGTKPLPPMPDIPETADPDESLAPPKAISENPAPPQVAYDDPLRQEKMDAERPSDDDQPAAYDDLAADDTLDRAIMTRPEDLLPDVPPESKVADTSDADAKAEGIDLRIPDQQ